MLEYEQIFEYQICRWSSFDIRLIFMIATHSSATDACLEFTEAAACEAAGKRRQSQKMDAGCAEGLVRVLEQTLKKGSLKTG